MTCENVAFISPITRCKSSAVTRVHILHLHRAGAADRVPKSVWSSDRLSRVKSNRVTFWPRPAACSRGWNPEKHRRRPSTNRCPPAPRSSSGPRPGAAQIHRHAGRAYAAGGPRHGNHAARSLFVLPAAKALVANAMQGRRKIFDAHRLRQKLLDAGASPAGSRCHPWRN